MSKHGEDENSIDALECEIVSQVIIISIHCKCLRGITGSLQVFPFVGKAGNIYRLQGNPITIMEFPRNL